MDKYVAALYLALLNPLGVVFASSNVWLVQKEASQKTDMFKDGNYINWLKQRIIENAPKTF